jgi:hypothetical protein
MYVCVLFIELCHHHHHHHVAVQPKLGLGLPCWGFVTITFLQGCIVSPAPKPQPGGPGLRIYDPLETGWPSCTPRHWVPILVAFYDMHGLQWDCSLIPATTRELLNYVLFFFIFTSYVLPFMLLKSN